MTLYDKELMVIVVEKDAITKLLKFFAQENSHKIKNESINPDEYLKLTSREIDVLRLITQGKNNNEIANSLKMSIHTIKADVCSILQKLNVTDRLKAAVKAVKENLI